MLKAGSRWKIGDGASIPVWNNNWIAGNTYLTLDHDGPSPFDNLKVSDCILPGKKFGMFHSCSPFLIVRS